MHPSQLDQLTPTPLELEMIAYARAILKGVGTGIHDVFKAVIHPIDNVIYPISLLAHDATIMLAPQCDDPEIELLRGYLKSHPSVYYGASVRMQQRVEHYKTLGKNFMEGDGPKRTEMLSEFTTGVFVPGFMLKGAKTLTTAVKNYHHFGTLAEPPLFANIKLSNIASTPPVFESFTCQQIRSKAGENYFIYVITENKELVIGLRTLEQSVVRSGFESNFLHHPDLAGLNKVYAAGEMLIKDGQLTRIDVSSGSYLPEGKHIGKLVENIFEKNGFTEATGKFKPILLFGQATQAEFSPKMTFATKTNITPDPRISIISTLNQIAMEEAKYLNENPSSAQQGPSSAATMSILRTKPFSSLETKLFQNVITDTVLRQVHTPQQYYSDPFAVFFEPMSKPYEYQSPFQSQTILAMPKIKSWEEMTLGTELFEYLSDRDVFGTRGYIKYAMNNPGQRFSMGLGFFLDLPAFGSLLDINNLLNSYLRVDPTYALLLSLGNMIQLLKEMTLREIGGVASEVAVIKNLIDSEAHAQINTAGLTLCLPTQGSPLDNQLVQRIFREISDIRTIDHSDIFLSLNFAKDGALVSIAHPALKGTLLGDIALWIDYELKGVLNGYTLPKEFASTWEVTQNRDEQYLKKYLVNLKTYCEEKSCQGQPYFSLRELMNRFGVEETELAADEQPYQISFRVIAYQEKIERHGNIIIPHPQFKVEYSIEKTADYAETLETIRRTTGSYPKAYQNLEIACSHFANEIKSKLPYMPFSSRFLSLLGVANSWSYITETMKKMGKAIVIEPQVYEEQYPFPAVLPPLPVEHFKTMPMEITFEEIFKSMYSTVGKDQLNTELTPLFVKRRPVFSAPLTGLVSKTIRLLVQTKLQHQLTSVSSAQMVNEGEVKRITMNMINQFKRIANSVRRQLTQLIQKSLHCIPVEHPLLLKNNLLPLEQIALLRSLMKEYVKARIAAWRLAPVLSEEEILSAFPKEYHPFVLQELTKNKFPKTAAQTPDNYKELVIAIFNDVYAYELNHLDYFERDMLHMGDLLFNQTSTRNTSINKQYTHVDYDFTQQIGKRVKLVGGCGSELPNLQAEPIKRGHTLARMIPKQKPNSTDSLVTSLEFEGSHYDVYHFAVTDAPKEYQPLAIKKANAPTSVRHKENQQLFKLLNEEKPDLSTLQADPKLLTVPLDRSGAQFSHYAAMSISADAIKPLYDSNPLQLWVKDQLGYLPIHAAARTGNLELITDMLRRDPKLRDAKNHGDITPLFLATQCGQFEVVNALVEAGAAVFYPRVDNLFPLYVAIQHGYSNIALLLLSRMTLAEINFAMANGMTSLHLAIEKELSDVAMALLRKGAACDLRRKVDGFTAFHLAVQNGRMDIIQHMITHNHAAIDKPVSSGDTAVHIATKAGHAEVASFLQTHNANLNLKTAQGDTALMLAIYAGHKDIALQLAATADINAINAQQQTASLLALLYGLPLVGDRLLARGENPALLDNSGFSYGYHLVSHGDYFRFMTLLEKKRLDPHALYHGASLVSIAAQFGQFAIVHELIKQGVAFTNNDPKLSLGYYAVMHDELMFFKEHAPKEKTELLTLIQLAGNHGSIRCLEWLLAQNLLQATEIPALYEAAISSGNLSAVKLIIRYYKDTNIVLNKEQETAILIAARLGLQSIVELLIEFGADSTRKNKAGQTVYHIAIGQQDKDLLISLFELTSSADWPQDLFDNQQYPSSLPIQAVLTQYRAKMVWATEKPKTVVLSTAPELKMPTKEAQKQLLQLLEDAEFEEAALFLEQNKLLWNLFKTDQGGTLVQLIFKQVLEPSSWWPFSQTAPHDSLLILFKRENIDLRLFKGSHNVLCEIIDADNSAVAVYRLQVLADYFPDALPALIADQYMPQFNFMRTVLRRHLIPVFTKMDSLLQIDRGSQSTRVRLFSLHEAVREENDVAILAMLGRHPINERNNEQQTALMLASGQGNTRLVKLLITNGANHNLVDIYGATLLHYAISSGKEDTALFILPLLMHKNQANRHGVTPLMLAAQKGMSSIVRYLCQDADYTGDVDHFGRSAMHWAAEAGQDKCIEILAQHEHPVDYATATPKDKTIRNQQQTPLHMAASRGHVTCVSSLLSFGADPSKLDSDGFSLCEHAVMSQNPEVQRIASTWPECASSLHQTTLLHALCQRENISKLSELLLSGTLTDKPNDRGQNALHICAVHGSVNTARILLESAVTSLSDLNQPAQNGLTPVMLASLQGNVAMIELFAEYDANLNVKNPHNGKTALHFAVMQEKFGAVTSLLMHKADYGVMNSEGLTPLQTALLQGSIAIACRLALAGDPSYQEKNIQTLPQTIQSRINLLMPQFNQALLELKNNGAQHQAPAKKQALVEPLIPLAPESKKDIVSLPYSPPLFKPQWTAGTRISIEDSGQRVISEASLLTTVDFDESLEQSLAAIKQYYPAMLSQWQSFCTALIKLPSHELKKSEKQMLLAQAFSCFKQELKDYEPAQWLTLTTHLKSVYGETILYQLFNHGRQEKLAATNKATTFRNYLTVMQILLDLQQEPGINALVKKLMPDLPRLVNQLQEVQAEMFARRYPVRDIDVVLTEFLTPNELVQFRITADEAATLKDRYQAVQKHLSASRTIPLGELALHAKQEALSYQQSQAPESLDKLLAITIETLRRVNKLNLYDTQILSILLFLEKPNDLRGRAAQIGPGQGKSAIIAVEAAFYALLGHKPDIITSSSYLAQFGEMTFKPFYEALGLTSSSISHSPQTRDDFNADILYGVITDYQFPYLREGLYQSMLRYYEQDGVWVKRPFDLVIIDEFDNVAFDLAFHSARMAVPAHENIAWIYEPMLQFAKQNPKTAADTKILSYLSKVVDEKYHQSLRAIDKKRLVRWYESAKLALFEKKEGRDYVIKKAAQVAGKELKQDTIVIVDYSITGRPAEDSEWQNGLHQLLQAKHGLAIKPESLMAASISPIQYLNLYQTIFGLTGTLGNSAERKELLDVLHIDTRDVPPRFKSQLIHHELALTATNEEQYESVAQQLRNMQLQGRPVLVLLETINDARKLENYLKEAGFQNYQVLDTQQKENENYLVARAGESGMITISTNAGGRGTDIILSPASLAAGGLHTLFLFYPQSTRVQIQGENRGARQGQLGSCGMILSVASLAPFLSSFGGSPTAVTSEQLEAIRQKITAMGSSYRSTRLHMELAVFNQLQRFFILNNALHHSLKSEPVKNHLMNDCQLFSTTNREQLVGNFCDAYLESTLQTWTQFYSALHHDIEIINPTLIPEAMKQVFSKYERQLTWYMMESGVNALRAWENIATQPLMFDDKQTMMKYVEQSALEMLPQSQPQKKWDFETAAHQQSTDSTANHVAFIASRNNDAAEKKSGQSILFPVVDAATPATDTNIWQCQFQSDGRLVCADDTKIRVVNRLPSVSSWNETGYDDSFQCQPLADGQEGQYCLGQTTEFIEQPKHPIPPTEPNTAAVLGSAALSGFASTALVEGVTDTLRLLNYVDEQDAENVRLAMSVMLIACSGSWLASGASMATKSLLKKAGCRPSIADASATVVSCAVSLGVNATPTGLLATAVNLASSKFGFWAEKKVVAHFDKGQTHHAANNLM